MRQIPFRSTTVPSVRRNRKAKREPLVLHDIVKQAQEAGAIGKWTESLNLWRKARQLSDNSPMLAVGEAHALISLGREDDAETLLADLLAANPSSLAIARCRARVAERRREAAAAIERWQWVLTLAPEDEEALRALAWQQRQAGDLSGADVTLRRATRLIGTSDLDIWRAATALELRKTPDAWAHWEAARALQPDHRLAGLVPNLETLDLRKLALGFVSLGGNCEFGLVQRRVGAEPLGLLRWASVFPTALIDAVEADFEGMEGETTLHLEVDASGEYLLHDRRYGLSIHCFVQADSVDSLSFLEQQRRRIAMLRGKLLQELREARKIFVYWQPELPPATIDRLFLALQQRYRSVTLLCVRVADESEPAPSVHLRAPGLLVGLIDRDGRVGKRMGWSIAFDQWLAVLLRASRMVRGGA